jgi:hypothetical protein
MMTGAADSGSAGTVLVEFSCALGMDSCGQFAKIVIYYDADGVLFLLFFLRIKTD